MGKTHKEIQLEKYLDNINSIMWNEFMPKQEFTQKNVLEKVDKIMRVLENWSNNETKIWQDIDTAPKDGTNILVCSFDYYYPETASYRAYHPNAKGKCTWRNASGIKINPTHWMPLFEKPF